MIAMPKVETAYFPLNGGLNLVTPPLSIPDGMCRDALNFEIDIDGGYRRIDGYERYDGRPAPSDALYYMISCTFSGTVAVADTITGGTSAATGVVIAVGADHLVFAKPTGTFQSGEALKVATVTQATSTSVAAAYGASTVMLDAEYRNGAADVYRADIQVVPGSGSVLGVWVYNGDIYAFRNNAGSTAAVMHKATTGGWSAVSLGYEVAFSNANTSVGDTDTLTQGAVTATINRVVVETGTLVSGVNTGRLIIGTPAGGNFAAGAATSSGGGALTLSGAQTAITLPPNGRYEFVNNNFGGSVTTARMYGCNGAGRAFEFDGTTFVPIATGMSSDTPSHIMAHKNHLFLSFGSSLQHSAIGNPYSWSVSLGAAELAVGATITGLLQLVGAEATDSLLVFTSDNALILYGSGSSSWTLTKFSFDAGGLAYTMQNVGAAYVMDNIGIRNVFQSQSFGNFEQSHISNLIRPFLSDRPTLAVGSAIVRKRNQYRLYFSDKYALYITYSNNQPIGIMPIQYGHTMTSFATGTIGSTEYVLCGSTSGYVYSMDKGTSFDGDPIVSSITLAFNHLKSPRLRKRYRKAVYEITGGGYAQFNATYELGYGSTDIEQGITSSLETMLGSVYWDSFTWDSFYWDGRTLLPAEQDLTGTAENLSLIIRSNSDLYSAFTINSAILHYTPRRNLR